MNRFRFHRLEIPEVILVESRLHTDNRGYFMEIYRREDFERNGIPYQFVQDNMSFSRRGVLRGLHFQKPPAEQGKLVRVAKGRIRDVAVDLRRNSPTFGRWVMVELREGDGRALWIPPGFAHGFYAQEDSIVLYKVTAYYSPALDAGIRWNDPDIAIDWGVENPILSDRDSKLPLLREIELPF